MGEALLGAAGAVLLIVLGAFLNARRERQQWVRQERLKAYTRLLSAAQAYTQAKSVGDVDAADNSFRRGLESLGTIGILGPTAVDESATALLQARLDQAAGTKADNPGDTYASFCREARVALGIKA